MIGYIIFIISMAISIMCISYDTMAKSKGWPTGEILSKDASLPKIAALITALWIFVKSFIVFHWWSTIIILIFGWLLAFIIIILFKKNAQFICILGIFPAFFFTTLYISETKPFGCLQKLFN